jgi:hypothetical protein
MAAQVAVGEACRQAGKVDGMWKFWQKPGGRPMPQLLRRALVQQYGLTEEVADRLRILQQGGEYSGRKVQQFQVFDPAALALARSSPNRFADLDHASVIDAGHIEREGDIVLKPPSDSGA